MPEDDVQERNPEKNQTFHPTAQKSSDSDGQELSANPVSATCASNNQRKKMLKRQKWLEQRPLRRAREKEKRKLKIQEARETGRNLGPSRKLLKSNKMCDSACKLKICFDLSLADVMTEQEFSKTFKQLHRCYSINRRAEAPLQLYITGYSESTKQKMSARSGCFNWDVNFNPLSLSEVFDKTNVVYLTSDSPNEISSLDNDKAYVIGALVDHNRLKNICFEKAEKEGFSHARLPLDAYFKFKTRKVLTIDQVYLIFLRLTEGKSWVDAILETVPKRKGVELKGEEIDSDSSICDEQGRNSEYDGSVAKDTSINEKSNKCDKSMPETLSPKPSETNPTLPKNDSL